MQKVLALALAATLLAGSAHAQTRPGTRPAPRPATHPTAKAPAKHPATPAPKAAAAPSKPTHVVLAAAPAKPTPAASQPVSPAPLAKTSTRQSGTNSSFHKGCNAANLGIGFGLGYGYGTGSNVSQTPALSLAYQRGVADVGPGTISVGGVVGYKSIGWKDAGYTATWRNIYAGARGAYHYGFHNPKLDVYAGLGLGVRVVSYSDSDGASSAASGSQVELSSFVGARYFFTNTLGAFSELGYDMSYLKVGVSARF